MNAFKRPRKDADHDDAFEILVLQKLKLEAKRDAILESTKELNRQITMLDQAYERLQLVKKMNRESI